MRPRGIPRGKHLAGLVRVEHQHLASMRPRGIPRGKLLHLLERLHPVPRGFNEAAGNTPRKTYVAELTYGRRSCFNEAAGNTPRKTSETPQS